MRARLMCAVCVGLTVTGLITSNTYVNAAAATAVFFLVGVAFTVAWLDGLFSPFVLTSLPATSSVLELVEYFRNTGAIVASGTGFPVG